MTHTFTCEDTGRAFVFPSEEAFDEATAWAAASEKHTMVRTWTEAGHKEADLLDGSQMAPDWQERIMEVWAARKAAQ